MRTTALALTTLLIVGCAGRPAREPTTAVIAIPRQGDWFCQMNVSGAGWDCVQDAELARAPHPARLPEPARTTPDAVESDALEDEDARPRPAAEALTEPPPPAKSTMMAAPGDPAVPDDPAAPAYLSLAYRPAQPTPLTELPGDLYAVQLVAMKTRHQVERFLATHEVEALPATRIERDGELYYVLILGLYGSLADAQRAVAELPAALADTDPWIRPLRSLQSAIERADGLAEPAS